MGIGLKILLVALAGALGTLSRWGLGKAVQSWAGPGFSWGTAAVNVLGCFLFGLIWTLAEEREVFPPEAGMIVLTGFMGAFTTFSTFIFETGAFARDGEPGFAMANVIGQVVVGLAFLFAGIALAKAV